MRKLKVNTVFIDLQGTITDDASRNNYSSDPDLRGNYFGGILRDILVRKLKLSSPNALRKIKELTKSCGWIDPFYAVSHSNLGITEAEMWEEVLKWQDEHLIIFEDAVEMIKELHKRKFNLYMVSNCARIVVLSQLTGAGLAEKDHSFYFKQIYGCFDLGLQKNNSLVYKKILEIENLNSEKTVMVGNEPGIDLESPHKAGIKQCFIVNRRQKEKIVAKGGGIFVKTLQIIPQVLERK